MTDVDSFCAVSWADRRAYCDVRVCMVFYISPRLLHWGQAGRITAGVARRCGGSGGCRKGEVGREDLSGLAAAWYSGKDGVEALDILAWPKATVATLYTWLDGDSRQEGRGCEQDRYRIGAENNMCLGCRKTLKMGTRVQAGVLIRWVVVGRGPCADELNVNVKRDRAPLVQSSSRGPSDRRMGFVSTPSFKERHSSRLARRYRYGPSPAVLSFDTRRLQRPHTVASMRGPVSHSRPWPRRVGAARQVTTCLCRALADACCRYTPSSAFTVCASDQCVRASP